MSGTFCAWLCSAHDAKKRLTPDRIQAENYEIQTAYDYFCDEFENMLGAAFGVAPAMQGIGETESDEKDLLRNTITAVVNKVYLDRYLAFYREAQDAAPSEQE